MLNSRMFRLHRRQDYFGEVVDDVDFVGSEAAFERRAVHQHLAISLRADPVDPPLAGVATPICI